MQQGNIGGEAESRDQDEATGPKEFRATGNAENIAEQKEMAQNKRENPCVASNLFLPSNRRGSAHDHGQSIRCRKPESVCWMIAPFHPGQTSQRFDIMLLSESTWQVSVPNFVSKLRIRK